MQPLMAWQRAFVVMLFFSLVWYAGSKVKPPTIQELLTVLSTGQLTDLSGKIASGVQARAIQSYIEESDTIIRSADGVVEKAEQDYVALIEQLASADYSVVYIAYDLPRGTPVHINHNVMVSFERVEQSSTNLTAYVWFSEIPTTNINVVVEYSLQENSWLPLSPISDSYPVTYDVNGIDCYKYTYVIPGSIAGTPLKPQYEIEFGGAEPGQWLNVPEDGIVVEVDDVQYNPYTGWDDYSEGADSLHVRHVGGVAVSAIYNGVTYKGGINEVK